MNPRQEDREISDIDGIFLLEMYAKLGFAYCTVGKGGPCPMVLAVHDAKNFFLETILGQRARHRLLPSFMGAS